MPTVASNIISQSNNFMDKKLNVGVIKFDRLVCQLLFRISLAHHDVFAATARVGKAIFSEKLLSLSMDQCKEMAAVIQETGTFFQLGFMRRFDIPYPTTKQKMVAGEIE